jgi:hypothetical protein
MIIAFTKASFLASCIWLLFFNEAMGHMLMSYPLSRGLPANSAYGNPDYNLNAPLSSLVSHVTIDYLRR